jgi:hypothetical protein
MPVADEHTVTHTALRQGISHVRTAVVAGIEIVLVTVDGQMVAIDREWLTHTLFDVICATQFVEDHVIWGCRWLWPRYRIVVEIRGRGV